MSLKTDAANRGIRLTYEKNGKRVRKTESRLIKEIRNHDDSIISKRARQTKGMILMCKSVLGALNNQSRVAPTKKVNTPFMTPPTSPPKMMKPPPPPPPPPLMKKNNVPAVVAKANYKGPAIPMSLMNALKVNLNKRGIKKKLNQNAKTKVA
tara:strand:+ start:1947 stop:2402 length:456 start_codon:yes stop_codon:yes gene_type:complete